jgi:hypothetical protein
MGRVDVDQYVLKWWILKVSVSQEIDSRWRWCSEMEQHIVHSSSSMVMQTVLWQLWKGTLKLSGEVDHSISITNSKPWYWVHSMAHLCSWILNWYFWIITLNLYRVIVSILYFKNLQLWFYYSQGHEMCPSNKVHPLVFFLEVFSVFFFCNMADVPVVDQSCPSPAKYALVHLLYGLCNPDLQ